MSIDETKLQQPCSCVCEQCKMASYVPIPKFNGKHLCRFCKSKLQYPHWPRGKYNGQRIVGISFKITISVTEWRWKPIFGCYCGAFHWLFWMSWTEPKFDY